MKNNFDLSAMMDAIIKIVSVSFSNDYIDIHANSLSRCTNAFDTLSSHNFDTCPTFSSLPDTLMLPWSLMLLKRLLVFFFLCTTEQQHVHLWCVHVYTLM